MTAAASPARRRADAYAALAPKGATVTVTEEEWELLGEPRYTAQVYIRGTIDSLCITIGSKATGRTCATANRWYHLSTKTEAVKIGWLPYEIRNLYV